MVPFDPPSGWGNHSSSVQVWSSKPANLPKENPQTKWAWSALGRWMVPLGSNSLPWFFHVWFLLLVYGPWLAYLNVLFRWLEKMFLVCYHVLMPLALSFHVCWMAGLYNSSYAPSFSSALIQWVKTNHQASRVKQRTAAWGADGLPNLLGFSCGVFGEELGRFCGEARGGVLFPPGFSMVF